LNSFYRDLDEKRRKSASTMNDEEESEVGQDELEEATNAKTSIAEANHDTNALSNDEKIIRAEKVEFLKIKFNIFGLRRFFLELQKPSHYQTHLPNRKRCEKWL
jgi:hypothetical protein